ncbi:MAG: DUF427 domain-containing protein [Deltaproteobacteria bacterium]|nr:DUF427 domain-containing protein [Deltaproteobacteria bacterium]
MEIVHKPRSYGERTEHWLDFEESPRRVRVRFGGETLADTKRAMLLREAGHVPVYYFPQEDVRMDLLTPNDHHSQCSVKGEASYWDITAGSKTAESAAWSYLDPKPGSRDIAGYLSFYWNRMDGWYEEEDEIFVHARDPYKRVDVLQSSRHVQVTVGGEVVADSTRPRIVLETGHLIRYYLPREDVRADLLEPSDTQSRCPYKGTARYWSVRVGDEVFKDTVWSYEDTIPECPRIKDLMCFFNERVDAIHVDGERLEIPRTKWSRS